MSIFAEKKFAKMKRCLLSALILVFAAVVSAQEQKDTSRFVKKGVSFGLLPAVSYDADLGFQYGLMSNLYWYGDGSRYPKYDHSLYLECSRYSAGTMLCRAYFDSPTALSCLSPSLRLTADVTWFRDLLMDFSGFNGREAVYNRDWIDEESDSYVSRAFYNHHRRMLRGMANVRRNIPDSKLYWQVGATVFNMDIESVHRSELCKDVPDTASLYDLYRQWGVIRQDEAGGGTVGFLRLGFGIDSRDSEAFPTSGVWTEGMLALAPGLFTSQGDGYARLTLVHRQYFRLGRPNLVLAYRMTWQHKLGGRIPFYVLPHITTATLTSATSQGLGGAKTMRGIVRNRIVGDGSLLGNVEFRWLITRFKWLGQQWGIGTNFFGDFGMVTQDYGADLSGVPLTVRSDFFRSGNDKMHSSVGMGVKVHFNANFIVSCDFGKSLSEDDGSHGLYVQMNYLF